MKYNLDSDFTFEEQEELERFHQDMEESLNPEGEKND